MTNKVYKILRRVDEDWTLITEIVDEGIDAYNPCNIKDGKSYVRMVIKDSTYTYLLNFDTIREDEYNIIYNFYYKLILERMGKDIMEYWSETRIDRDCN
jgi:hypothetical protein